MSILRTLTLGIALSLPIDGMAQELMLFPASTFGKVVAPQNQTLVDDVLLEAQVGDYNNEFVANYGENSVFARTGRSVGMLQILTNIGHAPCTGFLVEGNKVITNHHCVPGVLENPRMKERGATTIAAVQFHAGFFNDGVSEGVKSFFVDPVPIESSEDLDYSILQVMDDANAEFGALELSASQPDDRAPFWVIGHPMGEAQRISREKCQASTPAISSGRLRHTCDTLPGNSGSPVIDPDSKLVVALHHAGSRAGNVNYAIPMADILEQSKVLKAAVSAPPIVAATVAPRSDPCDPQFALAKRVNQCAVWDGYLASCSSHSKASEARRLKANVCKVDACDGQFEKAKASNSCDSWKSYAQACGNHDGLVVAEMAVELTCKPVAEEKPKPAVAVLANWYRSGEAAFKRGDYSTAKVWFQKAAEHGHLEATKALDRLADISEQESKPTATAVIEWKRSADEALRRDEFEKAVQLYLKGAKAQDPCSQYQLATMYQFGKGVTRSISIAKSWYIKATEHAGNCSRNAKYALERLAKPAVAPNTSTSKPSAAMIEHWVRTANAYFEQDKFTEAVKWYRKAADQGNARAQTNLGIMYEDGKGVRKSYTEAAKWYRKAAAGGDAQGQCNLAIKMAWGEGTAKDPKSAADWTIKSLQKGYDWCVKNMTESATVREIQKILKQRGLYRGAIDGSNGPNTQAAMRKLLR